MRSLGPILRLQIQLDPLKVGEGAQRVFDPSPVREVPRVWIGPEGLMAPAPGGGFLLDVHHSAHPRSRNREGLNALSIGFTSHYEAMRTHFEKKLPLGIAGETLIVESKQRIGMEDLKGNLFIRSQQTGTMWPLSEVHPAPPCAPFATFMLGGGRPEPSRLKEALRFLSEGTRGFYVSWTREGTFIELGDELVLLP